MTPDGNTHHLQTKVSPELAARIARSAARRGVSVSQWLRERATDFFVPDGPSALRQPGAADLAVPPDRAALEASLRATDPELYAAMDDVPPSPVSFADIAPAETWLLPHLVQPDGSCVGGDDPDTDRECCVGPDDPRRTGKRKRR